jgi:hypothetical protein
MASVANPTVNSLGSELPGTGGSQASRVGAAEQIQVLTLLPPIIHESFSDYEDNHFYEQVGLLLLGGRKWIRRGVSTKPVYHITSINDGKRDKLASKMGLGNVVIERTIGTELWRLVYQLQPAVLPRLRLLFVSEQSESVV